MVTAEVLVCFGLAALALLLGVAAGWVLRGREAAGRTAEASQLREQAARQAALLGAQLEQVRGELEAARVAQARSEAAASRTAALEAELGRVRAEAAALGAAKARLEAEASRDAAAAAEKLQELTALRADIEARLRGVAADALRGNQEAFLQLAEQVLERHKAAATGDLELRHKAIEGLVSPVAEVLKQYREGLARFEHERTAQYAALQTEVQTLARAQADVRQETSKLVNALRAAPKTRGRWGEQQLRTVLELSGMVQHVDFAPEQSFTRDGALLRPDVVIRMPGNRHMVVDAKTSLQAYLDACEATDDAAREECLRRHAGHVREHMRQLSHKSYWDSLTVTPDFVAMFVPGDAFFIAAMERDPALFEDAVSGRVLIVTPTTLIGLAKAVAYGWKQERLAEDAARIAQLGQELYKRLSVMGDHIGKLGAGLSGTVQAYNRFVGSLEHSVMPQARRFVELNVAGAQAPLPDLRPLEVEARPVRDGKDLLLGDAPMAGPAPDGMLAAGIPA